MKKDIHPKYQPIIFHDVSCNKSFLISSTLNPKEKMMYEDGKEYPVFKIETSSESHPFYTGKGRMETKEGRIAQFRKRYIAEPKTEEKAQTSAQPK
ncbi:MAG: type B 50S ribosomal protein L31, partial [Pseudomonadota bacterium]|nr:type B 50S ribosomal protein L31 [Pseudomonadota bacterium]